MQSRQARLDPLCFIARPNSSSASILLWLFLRLHFLAFFPTSLQDNWWNWNCWRWTKTKDDSIHHVWNFPLSVCLRVGFSVSMYLIWILGSKLILSNNGSRAILWVLETCLICRASSLYDHLDHCFVVFKHIQQRFLTWRIDVWGNNINIVQIINHSMRFLSRLKLVRCCTKLT